MSNKKENTSLIVASKRVRVLKYESLNLNDFNRNVQKTRMPTPSEAKKKNKRDIEVAEILADMKSESTSKDSNSGSEFEERSASPPVEVKSPKKKKVAKKPAKKKEPVVAEETDFDVDLLQRIEEVEEEKVMPIPEIKPVIENKMRLVVYFKNAMPLDYLLNLCRRITELKDYTDEKLTELLEAASDKYKSESHIMVAPEILASGQVLRYAIESGIILPFNLKNRTQSIFVKDAKKAMNCVRFVESNMKECAVKDVNSEWELCLDHALKVLEMSDGDKGFMYPIISETIHEKFLQGKHVKIYVAAAVCAICALYPTQLSNVRGFGEICEALNPQFNITRLNLYAALQTLLLHMPSMKSTIGLNPSIIVGKEGLVAEV